MSLQKTWGNVYPSALGAMLLSVLLVGCDNSVAQNAAPPAPAVSAADVVVKSISQWDSLTAGLKRWRAFSCVRAFPAIDKVNYTDGQEVKKGEVLFTIDDRTYRAALEQAQANLARAKTRPAWRKVRLTVPINWSIPTWFPVKSGSSVVRPPLRRRPIFAPPGGG
jgi:multidrug efflux system membrane fusion protein